MKIRNKLLFSYIINIAVITISVLIIVDLIVVKVLTEKHSKSAAQALTKITEDNLELSQKVLTNYGKDFVALKAESTAIQLSYLLGHKKTYNYNEMRQDPKLREIATSDINLNIRSQKVPVGYVDLMDDKGISVLHPNKSVEGRNFSEWKDKYPKMWELVEKSSAEKKVFGYYSFVDKKNNSRQKFMVIVRVPDTPFSVVAAVNIDDFYLSVWKTIKDIQQSRSNVFQDEMEKESEIANHESKVFLLITITIISLLVLAFGVWFADTISSPIVELRNAVQKIGSGNFTAKVEEKGDLEIIDLAKAFNHLGQQLSDYMDNLKKEVSVRQAFESEVKIAKDIQTSLIPNKFPPYPEHAEFNLFAKLLSVKEVAGDFYDFFFRDEETLTIIVGDVSGKGIPAAFFMAVTRTVVKNFCLLEDDPSIALEKANKMLCADNNTCMFVTMFLAYYNVNTGKIAYANAGHHASVKLKPDGTVSRFGILGDIALGVVPQLTFKNGEETMDVNDTLVLYTDGITEAVSPEMELYGEERFLATLSENPTLKLRELCKSTIKNVLEFEQGNRFDDITIVTLKRLG